MARDDGDHGRIPGKACAGERDVDAIAGRADEVPAAAERVRQEGDDVLALHEQEHQVVRDMVADGDGDEREGEALRHLERAGLARRHPAHDGADASEGAEEQEPECNEADAPDQQGTLLAEARQTRAQGVFDERPFARADEPVVKHARQQQQHERHHRHGDRAALEQATTERAQQQAALLCLGRRKAGEGGKHQREHLAMPQPGVAAIDEHARPGEQRIGERQGGDVRRRRCVGVDELDPGEGQQQQARGPHAQRRRIGQAEARLAGAPKPPIEPSRAVERGGPWVDEGPQVAGKRRDVGKAHPPDDPHQGRGDVAIGVLIAEEAGQDRHPEQAEHGKPQRQDHGRMAGEAAERRGEQVDLRAGAGQRRAAHEDAEHDERERNRRGGSEEIEPERQRQLVALPEAVRLGGGGGSASGGRRHPPQER